MKVVHIIAGLDQGGAEMVLWQLVSASASKIDHSIISMTGDGVYGVPLRRTGASVQLLDMPRGRLTLRGIYRLFRILRQTRPDVVQTWMYHANLVGGVVARAVGIQSVIWGIHNADLSPEKNSISTRLVAYASAALSRVLPRTTVFVSKKSLQEHQAGGFGTASSRIVHNGTDLTYFRPNERDRVRVRAEWDVSAGQPLLGFVGRWDIYKDHRNLLLALARLVAKQIPFRCVLVGKRMDEENVELVSMIAKVGLTEHMILAGSRSDIPAVMNALDVHVLSSSAEAFGNVIVEAMACGTPCVTTDVGAAAMIVGEAGWVVPPGDPAALADGIEMALRAIEVNGGIAEQCRRQVEQRFDLDTMVREYQAAWIGALQ